MTRFEELEKAEAEDISLWTICQNGTEYTASVLYKGLKSYLGGTDNDFALIPTIGDYDPSIRYSPHDAVRIGDDSFFHFGILILLEPRPVLIPFKVKWNPVGEPSEYKVRVGEQDQEFTIRSVIEEQHVAVFEYVFQLLKEDIEQSLFRWLKHDETTGPPQHAFYRPNPPWGSVYAATPLRREVSDFALEEPPMADWLTTEEAVEFSGYDIEHVRRLIRQHKVNAIKKGRDWWISRHSLAGYVETMRKSEDKRAGPKSSR